jgi:hypothetical protein
MVIGGSEFDTISKCISPKVAKEKRIGLEEVRQGIRDPLMA